MLPLPHQVTERVLTARHLNIDSGNLVDIFGPADLPAEVRQGLPQGSAASSLVTEILLAPIAFALPIDVRAVIYADNILVLMREKSEAVTMGKTLHGALRCHPAGPLWPKMIEIRDAWSGFDFLGYHFSNEAGLAKAEPTSFNFNRFKQKHYSLLKQLKQEDGSLAQKKRLRQKARRYVQLWCPAFSLWSEWLEFRTKMLAEIESAAVE